MNTKINLGLSDETKDLALQAFEKIKNANSILLHFHPSPDPDSTGSALGLSMAILNAFPNKKVTVIKGDSDIPSGFSHMPGMESVLMKSYKDLVLGGEISNYDLFIACDSGSVGMISSDIGAEEKFPKGMFVIVIDHHHTNTRYGNINIVDSSYPAACTLIADLLTFLNIEITPDVARNLFVGTFTDTGGFRYGGVDKNSVTKALNVATRLSTITPLMFEDINIMENSNSKDSLAFEALALSSIQEIPFSIKNNLSKSLSGAKYIGAFSPISNEMIKSKGINMKNVSSHGVPNKIKSVIGYNIGATLIEEEVGVIKISMRSRDAEKFDVSKVALALGGGGHKAAAGAKLKMGFEDAKKMFVDTVQKLFV